VWLPSEEVGVGRRVVACRRRKSRGPGGRREGGSRKPEAGEETPRPRWEGAGWATGGGRPRAGGRRSHSAHRIWAAVGAAVPSERAGREMSAPGGGRLGDGRGPAACRRPAKPLRSPNLGGGRGSGGVGDERWVAAWAERRERGWRQWGLGRDGGRRVRG